MRSLLLGLDVSPKRLGWGLVDLVTGEPVACGCEPINLPSHGWMHQQVAFALQGPEHVLWHGDVNPPYYVKEIQCVYIEDTAQAGKYRQHDAGRAQGIVQAEVERRWPWATVQFLKPSEWKKLAGLKGNATKAEVLIEAACITPLGFLPYSDISERGITRLDNVPQDAADALLIAVAGQRRNQENWERSEAA